MEKLTEAGREARARYVREYRKNATEEQKQKRREYAREWRKNNPDKVKAARVRYWNKKAEGLKGGG